MSAPTPADDSRRSKLAGLERILKEMRSVLVAFSGGVDSTLLLKIARDTLGEAALAVVVMSEIHPARESEEAQALAETLRADLTAVSIRALDIPGLRANGADRCYFCKRSMFTRLKALASEMSLRWVADGANADDAADYRPGRKASHELGIRSPLAEAGLTKGLIRAISRDLGLPTWDKPSMACLASRVPYGEELTEDVVRRVDDSEEYLRELGFRQVRVRVHGGAARVEVAPEELDMLMERGTRAKITDGLKRRGFTYVAADLEGYRPGSMNEVLDDRARH